MTNKYTSEHFSELLNDLCSACSMIGYATSGNERQNHRATKDKIKAEIIDAVAALLRERESAKAGVTSQMRATACDAYDKEMVGHGETANPVAMRAALETVAPMLASARVPVEMPADFGEWFGKNYPGPDTIIGNPHWHAPRIWRAARRALLAAAPKRGEDV